MNSNKRNRRAVTWGLAIGLGVLAAGPSVGAEKSKSKPAANSNSKLETPTKSLSLGKVAEGQKSPERERLDAALRDLKEEHYPQAAVALYEIQQGESNGAIKDEAEYNLAKALYRMKLNHAALNYFTDLLQKGPAGKFYRSALEWSLFVARKVVADERVLDAIARYSDGGFPDEYKNEFRYNLARYHYLRALAIESGSEAGPVGETKVEETVTGGKSLKGDVFDSSGGGGGEEEKPEAADPDEGAVKHKKGGVSLGSDVFGEEPAPKKKEEKPAANTSGEKGKKGKKGKTKHLVVEEPPPPPKPVEAPKPPEPPKPEAPKAAAAVAKKDPNAKPGDLNAKEHIEAAQKMIAQVESNSSFGARAKFMEGVLQFKQNHENDALDAFKAVLKMTKGLNDRASKDLRQLTFFQLARTHFGAKQPSFSIYYYDKVERLTYDWLEAIYESSWAEFRLGNYEKALGNLLTLHSPFFESEYFPESHILKAVVYYENCRYPEAKTILADFMKRYEPILGELQKMTARDQSPDKWYETLSNLKSTDIAQAGGAERAQTLAQILQIALTDEELDKLDSSTREVTNELAAYKDIGGQVFTASRLRTHLDQAVGEVQKSLQRDAGRAVKRRLESEREAIKLLIQQALRINIETARAEQERIESTLRDVNETSKDIDKEFVEYADDEKNVWPFSDEYWRDELGTYQLTLAHSCH